MKEAEKLGVDMSMNAACKKLRNLAKLDRIRLDQNEHRSGLNKHLFDYLEYCGYDVLDYVKEYLSCLQPYMITRDKSQEKREGYLCVIDNLYLVSVYIKVDTTQFEEVIISFHEDNKRGVAKINNVLIDQREFVPIYADCILGKIENENKYSVKALFQRGLKVLPIELPAIKCNEVFIVRKKTIDNMFLDYCNDYIRDLYTSELELDFDKISVFSMLQQISFTSYGRDTFSSISLLIDSIVKQNDVISKSVADFAMVTFVRNLKLTEEQRQDVVDLLYEKFKVTAIRGIDSILERVSENISMNYDMELVNKKETVKNIPKIQER